MTVFTAAGVSKSFGERTLFKNVSFTVQSGDKIGLVGSNGCGKTTLIKMMIGLEPPDEGGFSRNSGAAIGYLEQHACADSDRTAFCEALEIFKDLMNTELELERLNLLLEKDSSDELIAKQVALNEKFINRGGLTYKSRTRAALLGLGLRENELELPVRALSGGQKAKIGFAKLLLNEPQLLLLDEPTNHLDLPAVEWLQEFLTAYRGAVILISHDRYFLDKVTDRTFEIAHQRLTDDRGNYTRHLKLQEERNEAVRRDYENKMREIKRIEGIIEQQRTFSMERNYRTIDHKQKSIDRIKETLVVPESEQKSVRVSFPLKSDCGNDVLKSSGLSCRYGERTLFNDVEIDVKKGERVFLLGANGCGKTTLMKALLNGGKTTLGSGVCVGYFDQMQADLPKTKTVFEVLRDAFPRKNDTELRTALAAFLFFGDDVFRKIETLSGGERARVALCRLMLAGDNLLFLDEPTNHLDLRSREALENALSDYGGTLFIISHDRYLINRLATRILWLQDGVLTSFKGNYDEFCENRPTVSVPQKTTAAKQPGTGGATYLERKKAASELRKAKSAVARLEKEIEELEQKNDEINTLLTLPENSADYEVVQQLSKELSENEAGLERKMAEWEQEQKILEQTEE